MCTFLLTDDHSGVLETLAYLFGRLGHRTLLGKCGRAALEIARTEKIDAALVDLHMPGMNGLAVCRALREQAISGGADFPVMTAAAAPALAARAVEAGAVAVLRKPFDLDEVLASAEKYRIGAKPIPTLPPQHNPSFQINRPLKPDPSGSKPASAR